MPGVSRGGAGSHAPAQCFENDFFFSMLQAKDQRRVAGADGAQGFDARRQRFEHPFRRRADSPRAPSERITLSGPMLLHDVHSFQALPARDQRAAEQALGFVLILYDDSRLGLSACCIASPSVSSRVFTPWLLAISMDFAIVVRRHAGLECCRRS